MSIRFRCDQCGKAVRTNENMSGRTVKCPNCRHPLLVPDPDEPSTPLDAENVPPRTFIDRQMGWVGLSLILLYLICGFISRLVSYSDQWKPLRVGLGIVLMVCFFVGCVLSVAGLIRRRGEVGGVLGMVLGLLFLIWIAVSSGFK